MADREVKIKFVVDEAAARKASLLISDLTRSVEKLVAASSRVGQAMGGIGGAGGAGGSVNVRSGRSPIGGAPFVAAGGGKSQGGIVANVLGVQDAASLNRLISGTQQGFQNVSTQVKTFVDKSINDIQRLSRAVAGLNSTMGGGGRGGGGGGGSVFSSPVDSRKGYWDRFMPSGLDSRGLPPIPSLDPRNPAIPDLTAHARPAAKLFSGQLNPSQVAGSLFRGDIGGAVRSLGAVGGAAGLTAAAWLGTEKAFTYLAQERTGRADQTLNQPFDVLGRRGAIAQPFLRMHAAVNSRDVNFQRAFVETLNDKQVMASLGKTALRISNLEQKDFGRGTMTGAFKETWNSFRNWAGSKTGLSTDDAAAWLSHSPADEVTKKTMRDILRDNAIANLDPAAAAQFQQAVEAHRTLQDPTTSMLMDKVYGGAMGRVKTMRSLGLSTRNVIRKGPGNFGYYQTSAYEDREQWLTRRGWDFGDDSAGHQQLLGVGLGYGRAVGNIGLVSAGIGGLTNAAHLMQMGGTLGGSVAAGGAMVRAVQSSIGKNALDVAAGRDLFGNVVQQAVASGQWVGSRAAMQYAGMTAGLIGGGSAVPNDVGGQQMMASLVGAGMPGFGRFTQGTEAPLYRATSLMGAVGAMGGYGLGAEYLTKMDPGLLMTIARGGEITPGARAMGVTQERAAAYLKYQRQAPLFEMVDELAANTPGGKTLAGVRAAGGDFMDYINQQVGGARRGESPKQFQKRRADMALNVANDLGAAMVASGTAANQAEGAGIFLGQLTQDKEFAPYLRGKGVGAAAPKGAEAAALSRDADLVKSHGMDIVIKDLEKIIKALIPAAKLEGQAATTVDAIAKGAGGAGLPGSIGDVISALQIFKNRIEGYENPQRKVR